MKNIRIIFTIALIVLGFIMVAPRAWAATTQQTAQGGVTISPAFQEVTVKGNDSKTVVVFTITNNNTTPTVYSLKPVDMGTLDDTGGVVFAGLAENYSNKYGLANWISLDNETLLVSGKSKETIRMVISNDASLSPGGHYGAIIVKTSASGDTAQNNVSVSPQAAALLFVKKQGGEKYSLALTKTSIPKNPFRLPGSVALTFKNNGNVHAVPRGTVTITDPMGRLVKKGIINENSSLVLPERSRILDVAMNSYGVRAYLPGKYRVQVAYRDDTSQTVTTKTYSYYWLNIPVLMAIIIVTGGVVFGIPPALEFIKKKLAHKLPKKTKKPVTKIDIKTD